MGLTIGADGVGSHGHFDLLLERMVFVTILGPTPELHGAGCKLERIALGEVRWERDLAHCVLGTAAKVSIQGGAACIPTFVHVVDPLAVLVLSVLVKAETASCNLLTFALTVFLQLQVEDFSGERMSLAGAVNVFRVRYLVLAFGIDAAEGQERGSKNEAERCHDS